MILTELETRYLLAVRRWFHANDVELAELSNQEILDLYLVMRPDGKARSFEHFEAGVSASSGGVPEPGKKPELPKEALEKVRAEKAKTILVPLEMTKNPDDLAGHIFAGMKGPTRYVQAEGIPVDG